MLIACRSETRDRYTRPYPPSTPQVQRSNGLNRQQRERTRAEDPDPLGMEARPIDLPTRQPWGSRDYMDTNTRRSESYGFQVASQDTS